MEVTIWLVEVPMSTSSLDHLVGAGEHDFAVLRLRTNSNLLGCTTGRLAGFSPLSTRRDMRLPRCTRFVSSQKVAVW